MDELFEVLFIFFKDIGKFLLRCGKCNRYMKYINVKLIRLYCVQCDEIYSFLQNGSIKFYKELKCFLDEFELVLWFIGGKGKSILVCSYCYNYLFFFEMRKGMGCNQCIYSICFYFEASFGIVDCIECDDGSFVFDLILVFKWRFVCNKCNFVVYVFEDVFRVSVID